MNIIVVGLSHKTASVEIREKLSISEQKLESTIANLLQLPHIDETAIISTCNRLEIYAVVKHIEQGVKEINHFLAETATTSVSELQKHIFALSGRDAVLHLMRVAAGLESLVLGEGQILCQVKKAYRLGQTYKGLKKILDRLFKQAITAGKRIRNETSIGSGAVSISSAAVELAKTKVQDLTAYNITVIGAGKMSGLLIKHLLAKNAVQISIVNRSFTGAEELASKFPNHKFQLYSLSEMMSAIVKSDIVFTSTSAPEPILDRVKLEQALPKNHSLMLFDISVPRNVNADVNELENIAVYNVDDLQAVVAQNQETRRQMAQRAEVLLQEELQVFLLWFQSLEILPTISCLRNKVESIGEQELKKAVSRLGSEFSERNRKVLESLTKGIINKILHEPMVQLRTQQDLEVRRLTLQTVCELFNLDVREQNVSAFETRSHREFKHALERKFVEVTTHTAK
ncbi:glutamyl-tRNA reductase [Mastigocoleus testarum]|uniref:glutamyl-tRNA reductase n=1 Tax=Mastigocoleus testarum TaxID=996925 RepID=UPI0004195D93|nr:glutamyl-tRNA reductase [Mastigocoleus testarum]